MRKYILTDSEGHTPGGQRLSPGKLIQTADDRRAMFAGIGKCCCDSPLVAAMLSPFAPPAARLFMIHCWNVAVDPNRAQSYTVVKEMAPVPKVTLEQKLSFALAVVAKLYKSDEFTAFAEGWRSGDDRSAAAATSVLKAAEQEELAARDLASLAAWGESGGDDTASIKGRDDEAGRVLCVARAALRFAKSPQDEKPILAELAAALHSVHKLEKTINLEQIAREVLGPEAPADPRTLGAA